MKILMAGGKKTNNIVTPLNSRFKSGAVQIDTENTLDDIISYIVKGEVFDRAIVIEPAIVGERSEKGLDYARVKIVELLSKLGDSRNSVQFIFVVTDKELADVIKEEMFSLGEYRVKVILAKAKYKLKFFIDLCTLELSEIPNTYESLSATKITEDMVKVETIEGGRIEAIAPKPKDDILESIEIEDSIETSDIEQETSDESMNDEDNIEDIDNSLYEKNDSDDYEYIEPLIDDDEYNQDSCYNVDNSEEEEEESWGYSDIDDAEVDKFENPEDGVYGDDIDNSMLFDDYDEGITNSPDNIEETGDIIDSAETDKFIDPENERDADNGLGEKPVEKDVFTGEEIEDIVEPITDTVEDATEQIDEFTDTAEENEETVENIEVSDEGIYEDENIIVNTTDTDEVQEDVNNQYFSNDVYTEDSKDTVEQSVESNSISRIRQLLSDISYRKMSLVVTGSKGSGKTTIAYNIATLLANMGYPTLYVDCDTETRGASYIDTKVYRWVHSDDLTVGALPAAIGNVSNMIKYVGVIKPSLHVITMGLDQDLKPLEQVGINRDKLHRFSSVARTNYTYVIYDIPFKTLCGCGIDLVYSSEKMIYITDGTTRGMVNLMLDIADVGDYDLRQLIMRKTNIVLNKCIKGCKIFGRDVKNKNSLLDQIDNIIYEVVGDNVSDRFGSMNITKLLPFVPDVENFWFTKKTFTDTVNGTEFTGSLLKDILEA